MVKVDVPRQPVRQAGLAGWQVGRLLKSNLTGGFCSILHISELNGSEFKHGERTIVFVNKYVHIGMANYLHKLTSGW